MLNCFDLMSRAANMFAEKYRYAYFYGAKGQILTMPRMEALIKAEPEYFSKYSREEINRIIAYSEDKIGYDCSGFIMAVSGIQSWSTGYYEMSLHKTTPAAGTWGNILYTTYGGTGRHIGLDIGQGRFLHMGREGDTVEMGLIKEFPWEHSGQLPGISYFLTGDR